MIVTDKINNQENIYEIDLEENFFCREKQIKKKKKTWFLFLDLFNLTYVV